MNDDVLVKVEGVSKKFCKSLKRSLWYGVQDVSAEMFGRKGHHDQLRRNEFWAVNDVSFELKRGECLGLIGPNGAGKSTLLKMLNGLVKPDKGRITMRGRVGALIELGAGFNPILTGRENIYVNGSVLGFTKKEIDQKFDAIVDFAEIEEFIDTPVQNYSSGMKVRLGFAVAAQMEPDVLLVDEVLAVGDAGFRAKCFSVFRTIATQSAIILVTHTVSDVLNQCNRAVYIESGRARSDGPPRGVVNLYLDRLASPSLALEHSLSVNKKLFAKSGVCDDFASRPSYRKDEHRWAASGARIVDFETTCNGKFYPLIVPSDSNVEIRLKILFEQNFDNVVAGILIKTLDGLYIYGANTLGSVSGRSTCKATKGQFMYFGFRVNFSLAEGAYLLSLGISSGCTAEDLKPLDRRYDSILIGVSRAEALTGIVDLKAKCAVEKGFLLNA